MAEHPVPAGVFVAPDANDDPTIWLHRPERPNAPLPMLRKFDLRPGFAVEALWAHITAALPTTAPVCPECGGDGEVTVCANNGSHGCSHELDRTYPCSRCRQAADDAAADAERELVP